MKLPRELKVRVTILTERDIAKIRADALRAAADDWYGDHGPEHPLSAATWLRERANRIERGSA